MSQATDTKNGHDTATVGLYWSAKVNVDYFIGPNMNRKRFYQTINRMIRACGGRDFLTA